MDRDVAIAAGSADITPTNPVILGGYNKRMAPFTAIADRLEANALVIEGGGRKALIVSTDLLYPGELLRKGLLEALKVNENELFLCASHTHFAPMTAPLMPRLGVPDGGYVRFVIDRIGSLVRSIEDAGIPCYATYHEGVLNHSMNRRLRCRRLTHKGLTHGIGLGPNPFGPRDENVRLLKFCTKERPVALVWNYTCHASDFFDRQRVSAAYPGVVRARLRSELGKIPVLFLQGFSGNVRPPFRGISDGPKGLLRRVLRGPQFKKAPTKPEWQEWSNSLAESVASFARAPHCLLRIRPPLTRRTEVPEKEFAIGGEGSKSMFWHLIDCGEFRLVGINAEPVVEYRQLIAKYLAGVPFLNAGCLDQTHCYLPTDDMILEGGYEVEDFRHLFDFKPHFRRAVQGPIIKRLRETLEALCTARA
jgi:hypothetical protein